MQHDRILATVVFRNVLGTQTDRQIEVQLQGAALPYPTETILEGELDFRTVERALARLQVVRQTSAVECGSQRRFGTVPKLVGAYTLFRASGQFEFDILETEIGVDIQRELDERGRLGLHLVFGTEDVRIVLGEATHAHDAVQGTRRLVTMTGTELGQTHRQLAVAFQALIEHLHVARAVHRLDRVVAAFGLGGEHVVGVVGPVPGFFPERAIDHLRGLDLEVAILTLHFTHVLLKHLIQGPALRVPENHARRFFLGMEQAETLADLAMVAFFGFFDALDVGCQLFLVGPGSAVDALQLLVLGVATPVGTGQLGQLE